MKVIEAYDDLAWTRSQSKIIAGVTATFTVSFRNAASGRAVSDEETFELDLGEGNAADIAKLVKEWREAGRIMGIAGHKPRKVRGTYSGRTFPENKKLREWVDAQGIRARKGPDRPAYMMPSGKHTYPQWLWDLFDAREDIQHGLGIGGPEQRTPDAGNRGSES